jgi:hypothetical protein
MKKLALRIAASGLFATLASAAFGTSASAPPGRYTISSGTVLDTKTMLTWQQVAPASQYAAVAAATYCSSLTLNGGGWRLPTIKELVSLVDFSVAPPGPTIDSQAFPNTPGDSFWSSTPAVYDLNMTGWFVTFNNGAVLGQSTVSPYVYYLRCVR